MVARARRGTLLGRFQGIVSRPERHPALPGRELPVRVGLLLHQAYRRMPASAGPEEPAVGGEDRAIVFQGERQINAIP